MVPNGLQSILIFIDTGNMILNIGLFSMNYIGSIKIRKIIFSNKHPIHIIRK